MSYSVRLFPLNSSTKKSITLIQQHIESIIDSIAVSVLSLFFLILNQKKIQITIWDELAYLVHQVDSNLQVLIFTSVSLPPLGPILNEAILLKSGFPLANFHHLMSKRSLLLENNCGMFKFCFCLWLCLLFHSKLGVFVCFVCCLFVVCLLLPINHFY